MKLSQIFLTTKVSKSFHSPRFTSTIASLTVLRYNLERSLSGWSVIADQWLTVKDLQTTFSNLERSLSGWSVIAGQWLTVKDLPQRQIFVASFSRFN